MSAKTAALQHEVVSLYVLVDRVSSLCKARRNSSSYQASSLVFFDYIANLGDATKEELRTFTARLPKLARLHKVHRQKLHDLHAAWSEIHEFVKPAIDADTLNVPFGLVESLVSRFREIEEFRNVTFMVTHVHELNYFMVAATSVTNHGEKIARILKADINLPGGFGILKIPYSQGASLFSNLILAHEIAHFAFEQSDSSLDLPFEDEMKSTLGDAFEALEVTEKSSLSDTLNRWAEELFCDLFALRLVGPCYSLSFIETFNLGKMSDGAPHSIPHSLACEFSDSHPADAFRLQAQVLYLRRLGWWQEVRKFNSEYVRILEAVATLKEGDFFAGIDVGSNEYNGKLPGIFMKMLPALTDHVESICSSLKVGVDEYQDLFEAIQTNIHLGIVPSSLRLKSGKKTVFRRATPIALLNGAYRVYLESLGTLVGKIKNKDSESVEDLAHFAKRIEEWILKALEDYQLLPQEE